MKIFYIYSILSIFFYDHCAEVKKPFKVLLFIIASNDQPVYTELETIWRMYMHSMPHTIESYFLKDNPYLSTDYVIENDVVYCKTEQTIRPGILNKTLTAIEAFLPRIMSEFDYVIRTNLSSFYNFQLLINYLYSLPSQRCYSGSPSYENPFASGSGFILSPDLAQLLISHKHELYNHDAYDDVAIGTFMTTHSIKRIRHDRRDILSVEDWKKYRRRLFRYFQIRVKFSPEQRLKYETVIHRKLVGMFYAKNLSLYDLFDILTEIPD